MGKVKEFKTKDGIWIREEDKDGNTIREFFLPKKKTKKEVTTGTPGWREPRHDEDDPEEQVSLPKKVKKAKHSRTKCMECSKLPTVEVLWAEGKGHAWFCDKHFKEWKKKPTDMTNTGTYEGDIVAQRKIDGEASKHWKDGPSKKKRKLKHESTKKWVR